ncbi:MAG TPA: serine/threonine-protein kinase [Marinagarivorans sp.]
MSFLEIPGYQIIRPIDSGGMATVYLAEQTSLGREVAIKVMSDALSRDQGFAERFELEAKIASRLNHPNIVTIFDYGTLNNGNNGNNGNNSGDYTNDSNADNNGSKTKSVGTHYLVMALIDGQDLKSLQHKLNLVTRLQIIQDIANALNYAHQQGVIHRDIKPQNILVQNDSHRALLADFGIAKAPKTNTALTQTGMTLGTPHYMSPEQALGKAIDHRADIYSLGVVLYFLLTGSVPYDGDSEVAIGIKHYSEPIPALPAMYECFQHIIDKALAKTPEQRYQSAAEFANAVGKVSIDNIAALVHSLNDSSEAKTQVIAKSTRKHTPNKPSTGFAGFKTTLITAGVTATILLLIFWLISTVFFSRAPAATGSTPTPSESPIPATSSDAAQGVQKQVATEAQPPLAQQKAPANAGAISCSYSLINSWGSGWQGQILLSNPTTRSIQNWTVSFRLPSDSAITNSFVTRTLSQNDGRITLVPHEWNKTLSAKSQLEIGFQGNGSAPNALDDLHCKE